ncbi:toll/interleukin-1 receptor domain-containing protein [Gemmatimonas sp.]|uniref:toll/interleukin-1 receptor domain-containing protein n=1 Tax=Gemmatimonas sp. TaxID=1962908 RepID=UPI00286E3EE3|nr:toll/interleukin-1 receptor domain-containing protein [Gemmatimonas sp.]
MAKVFISHSGNDKPLVDSLVDLLQLGCHLNLVDIVCTSVEGAGIETGAEFIHWIDASMSDSAIVILVLTPNFYASRFCLAEMGAAWATKKPVFPLVAPSSARDPGVVFLGRQSSRMDSTGLDELRDRIAEFNPHTATATPRWTLKKNDFLTSLDLILAALPIPATVDRKQLETEKELTEAARQLYRDNEVVVRELRERIRLLELAKDATEVRKIRNQFSDAVTRYEATKKEVRVALDSLGRIETRAIYASLAQERWRPEHTTWDLWGSDIHKATKSGWILETEDMSGSKMYTANKQHPRLSKVFKLLEDLRCVIEEISEEDSSTIVSDIGCLLEVDNWQYWEEQLLDYRLLA